MTTQGYRIHIESLVQSIHPLDELEAGHRSDVLNWIRSGAPLCRVAKPDTPQKHLVSYFTIVDPEEEKLLLVDHRKALLWLPPGGHVEPEEHPTDTAQRELHEELGIRLPLFSDDPLFITVTQTVGLTAGHVDVSLWYVFLSDPSQELCYDQTEFTEVGWFGFDELPLDRADPHLARFACKLSHMLSTKSFVHGRK